MRAKPQSIKRGNQCVGTVQSDINIKRISVGNVMSSLEMKRMLIPSQWDVIPATTVRQN